MSDNNFAARTQKLKDLRDACTGMTGFSPTQSMVQVTGMTTKVDSITTVNQSISDIETPLNSKQEERVLKVRGMIEENGFEGLIRRSRQIASYVDGLSDEYDAEVELIRRLVNKMQPNQTRRKKKNPDDKTRSTSEQGYASIVKYAEQIYDIINTIPDYHPTDTNIDKSEYQNLTSAADTLNSDIASLIKDLNPLIKQRSTLINSKVNGISKIIKETRKYVRGNYGAQSSEWNSIKHIKAT